MKALKILFYITMTLFFIIGIVVIYNNTNFWKNRIYLSCEFNEISDGFALVIDKKNKKVFWQGKAADQDRKRKLNSFTEVSIDMSWVTKERVDVHFFLDKLTGKFRMSGKVVEKEEFSFTGSCSEKQRKF